MGLCSRDLHSVSQWPGAESRALPPMGAGGRAAAVACLYGHGWRAAHAVWLGPEGVVGGPDQ